MGAKDFTELIAWQLANELKAFIYELTKRPAVRADRDFCREAIEAARSATKNIAEGFGRYERREFAQFLKIALASEFETRDNLLDAQMLGYLTSEETQHGLRLTRRAITAATRLRMYLLSNAPVPKGRQAKRQPDATSAPKEPPDLGTSEPDR